MNKMVQLTMVTGPASHNDEQITAGAVAYGEGEDDGLAAAEAREAAPAPAEQTSPVIIVDPATSVRNFYPRKPQRNGQPRIGTRITFVSGSGMAVTETFDEVAAKFGRAN